MFSYSSFPLALVFLAPAVLLSRYEQFLDISLPVVEDKPHKPVKKSPEKTRIPDDVDGNVTCCGAKGKSKSKVKKEKSKKRKDKRNDRKNSSKSIDKNSEVDDSDAEDKIKEELKGTEKVEQSEERSEDVEKSDKGEELEQSEESVKNEESRENSSEDHDKFEPDIRTCEDSDNRLILTSTGFHRLQSVDETVVSTQEVEEPQWEWDYGQKMDDKQVIKTKNTAQIMDLNGDEATKTSDLEVEEIGFIEDDYQGKKLEEIEESWEKPAENSEESEETGASSNGDVEDNDDEDEVKKKWVISKNYLNNLRQLDDLMNTSENLEPQMEWLTKGLGSLSLGAKEGGAGARRLRRRLEREKVELEWTARTLTGLAPRYQATPGECSLYSCLNSFTQSELLTGSNKWGCERCTLLKAGAEQTGSSNPTTVYSSASKQMLVFSPPAVLTIQLKRFQQTISGCKKVNKHVDFPLELDLAAFCSSTCVAMPNMEIGSKVLYSLYGVVEHSGTLRGGHYVAYVRARASNSSMSSMDKFFNPPLAKAGDVPSFLEEIERKLSKNKPRIVIEETEKHDAMKDAVKVNDTTPSSGKWFHVSDSSVSEASEDKVLRAQAYMLFYERIQ